MKKLALSLIFSFFISGFGVVLAAGSQSTSFSGSPSTGSFKGTNKGSVTSFVSSFNVSSIPAGADIQVASISISQTNGVLAAGPTISLTDNGSSVSLGTKNLSTSSGVHTYASLAETVNTWRNTPSSNQGVTFSAGSLDPDDDISFSGITLNVTYFVEDNTAPVISTVKSSSVTSNSAKITWITNEATLGFVDYGKTTGYGLAVAGSDYIINHGVSIIGLSPGTTYHFRVRGKDSSGNESVSGDFSFKTSGEATDDGSSENPSEPDNSGLLLPPENLEYKVEKKEGGGFIVILNWDKSSTSGIDGYKVYRAVEERFPIELYIQLDDDILTFTDENVEEDKTYYYLIRAYRGDEESSDSNEQVVKVEEVTLISKIPIKQISENFWISLGIVNAIAIGLIAGGYFLIKKIASGKTKMDRAKTPETLVNLSGKTG